MAPSIESQNRVAGLIRDAEASIAAGNFDTAKRQLQEASALDASNDKLKATWEELEKKQGQSPLVELCAQWTGSLTDDDGEEILDYLSARDVTDNDAKGAMETFLRYEGSLDMSDQICIALAKHAGARTALAVDFKKSPTSTFRKLWEHGSDSMDGLIMTLFDQKAWEKEMDRTAALRDVFQLALAELMQAGLEDPMRAMKVVSRLLAVEASKLNGIIDSDGFDVILDMLEITLPATLRSQATIAIAKLLELSPESAQTLIGNYVTARVVKPTSSSLLHAFSAAASVFPMAPKVAAELFLSEGFLSAFVPMVTGRKSHRVELAALELLSAACIDKPCREGIAKFCKDWLQDIAHSSLDAKQASLAALVLVKIEDEAVRVGSPLTRSGSNLDTDVDLVNNFKQMVLTTDYDSKVDAVEGLAYASLKPAVKENLAKDQTLLIKLIKVLNNAQDGKPALFGGLTIFAHLTAYRPPMTEEQQKLSQLKSYADTKKPAPLDPLDDDEHVAARCKKVLDVGVVPLLVTASKGASPTIVILIVQILLALSKEQKHRGVMSQQGAVKLLLQLYDHLAVQPSTKAGGKLPSLRTTAHALARILISVNPRHVFQSANALMSPIRPLTSLLTSASEEDTTPSPLTASSPSLLATFEALLALTNLASTDSTTADAIVRTAWTPLEDLLLSNNTLVQRGAAELVCNLCASPAGIAKFGDGTPQAGTRLHILLALADVEDVGTRRAAGGALAMLTEWVEVVEPLLKREKGVKVLLEMCADEDGEDLRHRGLVCVGNLLNAEGDVGLRAKEAVKKEGGRDMVAEVIKGTKNEEILRLGVGIVQALR